MREVVTDAVPKGAADYPGRVVRVPDNVTHVVFGLFGVQALSKQELVPFSNAIRKHFAKPSGPVHFEAGLSHDREGYSSEVFMAYWTSREHFHEWFKQDEVAAWWQSLPVEPSSDIGYWREILMQPKERFEFAAGNDDKVASASFLPLEGSDKFGGWGMYRKRLPASEYDLFESAYDAMPQAQVRETKGKRLHVTIPDNICVIREGQGWGNCGEKELAIWNERMRDHVNVWIKFLSDNPEQTGCLNLRDIEEVDVGTGQVNQKRSEIAYLLSLGHIEHAARTQATHLSVRNTFFGMYAKPEFVPRLHAWVEVHILKRDDFDSEYVNCHPRTGLLPFFEVVEVPGRRSSP